MRSSTPPRRWARVPPLLVVARAGLATMRAVPIGAAASAASANPTLTASPTTVAPSGTVTLSGALTNTGAKAEKSIVAYSITGPCGFCDAYTLVATPRAGESQAASAARAVPDCPGT